MLSSHRDNLTWNQAVRPRSVILFQQVTCGSAGETA